MAQDIGVIAKMSENCGYGRALFGRRVIYTDETEITASNVVDVVRKAFLPHLNNVNEINYLYNYYKGKQPILGRIKEIRPEINNKIVVNYANEIVSFKVGYLASEPIQYVALSDKNEAVNSLNRYMYQVGKQAQDQEIIEWNHICGTAYRYVQAKLPKMVSKGESPFELYTLDPRTTLVVYSSTFKRERMAGITYTLDENKNIKNFVVYTKNRIFTFTDEAENHCPEVIESKNALGEIPIYEYPANNARLGAFEVVLPLLDAINRCESNRVDGMEQQIQSFLKFINCDLDEEGLENLARYGAIKLKSIEGAPADVEAVKTDFSQDGAQTSKEDLYNAVLTICGMPVQGNGSSISANNGAILIQNGWSQAEARAKSSETMYKASERQMLSLIFNICRTVGKDEIDLVTSDVDYKFTRRNYENIQVKAQVLCEMLNTPRIHPKLAFESCGLFSDPENAYLISDEHYEATLNEWNIESSPDEDGVNGEEEETVRIGGSSDNGTNN